MPKKEGPGAKSSKNLQLAEASAFCFDVVKD